MAEKEKTQPSTVEVRLLACTREGYKQEMPDGSIAVRKVGDVFHVDRAVYLASIEPDRGMGKGARSRIFSALSDEKVQASNKAADAKKIQDRIAAVRESVQDQDRAFEQARALARVQEAENAKAIAEALKPLERPGGRRVA